jgi:CRP/FNR family cyclic AMP-dependent transcriptional regulator
VRRLQRDTGGVHVLGLEALEEGARRRLVEEGRRRRYRRGDVIFHAGDPATSMHVLLAGHVSVGVTAPMGDSAIFTVLGPGALFGELPLLTDSAERSATTRALDPVETLSLRADHVAVVRRADPAMDRFLISLLADRLQRQDARLMEALYVPVEKRVLRRLIALSRLYGGGAPGTVVPLTQEVLADLAGRTRPTANQGVLTLDRGHLRI